MRKSSEFISQNLFIVGDLVAAIRLQDSCQTMKDKKFDEKL